jgi:DNA-3-methyladenine glycosylase II
VGNTLELNGNVWYCYPDPALLAKTSDSTFRASSLTVRKGEYIWDISRLILTGDLDMEGFRNCVDTEKVIEEIMKIRGVGRWGAWKGFAVFYLEVADLLEVRPGR